MSQELLENFHAASTEAGLAIGPNVDKAIGGLADPHYGAILADNITASVALLEASSDRLPLQHIPKAVGVLGVLLSQSGDRYRATTSSMPSAEVWDQHIQDLRNGDIKTLPDEATWMTAREGIGQVQRADKLLGLAGRDTQLLLSALNYGVYFRPQTMAGASRTLAMTPNGAAESRQLEAMPHLMVGNWAIGQSNQHLYEQMVQRPSGALHIIDMCAGTGATSAAILNSLHNAQATGHHLETDRLSLLAVEGTPQFYDQYTGDFLPSADAQLTELGFSASDRLSANQATFDHQLQAGTVRTVEGDVTAVVEGLNFAELDPMDVVVGNANYGFHRLPSKQDEAIIASFAQAPNAVLNISCLWRNGSRVNRGYFNLANNGPLNAGNIGLESRLKQHGFRTLTIARDFRPDYIDKPLLDRSAQLLEDDGRMLIAFRGPIAEELVVAGQV